MGRKRGCECGTCGACKTWEYRHNRLARCKAEGCTSIQKSKGYCDVHRGLAGEVAWKKAEQDLRGSGAPIRRQAPRKPASIVDAPAPEALRSEAPEPEVLSGEHELVGHESREYRFRVLNPPLYVQMPTEALPPLISGPSHNDPNTRPFRGCDCPGCGIKRRIGAWAT